MSHWTSWLEPGSWLAGIIAALVAVAMAVQASNTSRMKATLDMAEPFVRALALSLNKPDILAAYESESATAKEILRKKTRRKLIATGTAVSITILTIVAGFLISQLDLRSPNNGIRFSVGHAAQHECVLRGLNFAANSKCTNRWYLDSSGSRIEARGSLEGPAREAELEVAVYGCSDRVKVRWELRADGETLGNGIAGSQHREQISNVPGSTSAFTIRAERIDDASCSAQLVVEAVVWL